MMIVKNKGQHLKISKRLENRPPMMFKTSSWRDKQRIILIFKIKFSFGQNSKLEQKMEHIT